MIETVFANCETAFSLFIFRAQQLMNRKLALSIETLLCVLFAILNIHVFFVSGKIETFQNSSFCVYGDLNDWIMVIRPSIGLFIYTVLPSLLIASFNTSIIFKLYRRQNTVLGFNRAVQKSISKTVPMVLVVSTVFVVCTLPICPSNIGKYTIFFTLIH